MESDVPESGKKVIKKGKGLILISTITLNVPGAAPGMVWHHVKSDLVAKIWKKRPDITRISGETLVYTRYNSHMIYGIIHT